MKGNVSGMKIMNLLAAVITLLSFSAVTLSAEAYRGLYHDPQVLAEMEQDPTHYYNGHGLGTGAGTYVDINTIAVEQYSPPEYIISYDSIRYAYPWVPKVKLVAKERVRLLYNYDKQSVYCEYVDRNNIRRWKFIEPGASHSMYGEADMIFLLAYNMHFYKNSKYQTHYSDGTLSDAVNFVNLEYDNTGYEHHNFK